MKQFNKFFKLFLTFIFLQLAVKAQTTQVVTGYVYDEASRTPLAGVVVVQMTNGITGAGTASDTAGNFRLTVPIGRQSFRLSYTGYESRMVNDVVVTAGKEVNLNVSMQEALHKLNEVTVVYNKAKDKTRTNNDMAQVSARSFNVDETKRYAGALGDPSRMAANFAGVASGNDATNDIVIRGNSPTGMLWQIDGVNIPNPNHYGSLGSTGGPVSMLNNNNIDKSDFLTSAFPAQYGNALSGVFDIKLREGNKDKPEFMAQMGFNGFEVGAEGPLGKNKKTSYLINYRYSTLGLFQKLGINFGTGSATPYYQDVNFKITTQLTQKSKLSLFGIAGASSIEFLGKDVDTTKTELYSGDPFGNESDRYGNTMTGLTYESRISTKTFTKLTVGYSTTYEKFDNDSISSQNSSVLPLSRTKFTTGKISAVWSLAHKVNAKNNIETGINYDQTSFNMFNKNFHAGGTDEVLIDNKGNYGLAQAYAQWKHRFSNNFAMVGGMHFQYITINNSIAAEPRVSFRYALNQRQAMSMGYGLHHQAQNIYTYFVQTPVAGGYANTNKELGFTRSQHIVLTYDWNITNNLRLKAEGYYQQLGNAPAEQHPSSFSGLNTGAGFSMYDADSLVSKGKGYNYGAEFTLERFFNKGYYFLVTTSLFQSRATGSDGIERNTAFNTGHVINVLGGKEFKIGSKGSVLAFNMKLSNVGGRYLTPIDLARSRAEGGAVYKNDQAFSEKQPDYFRADLKIAYRKEYKKSTLELAVDLQNLTNNQNIFTKYYDAKKGNIVTVYQQSFFPVPMIRYTF